MWPEGCIGRLKGVNKIKFRKYVYSRQQEFIIGRTEKTVLSVFEQIRVQIVLQDWQFDVSNNKPNIILFLYVGFMNDPQFKHKPAWVRDVKSKCSGQSGPDKCHHWL